MLTATDATPQLSFVIGVPIEPDEVHNPASVFKVTVAGHVNVGNSLSKTVMSNMQVSAPHTLEAITVTIVVPTGNIDPEAWE